MSSARIIKLSQIEGISRLSGTDSDGCNWIQFEVDYFAEQVDGTCMICSKDLSSGWLCLDGGDEVCDDHILIQGDPHGETARELV